MNEEKPEASAPSQGLRPVQFFRRGTGPLVSVLIATRSRPALLATAIDSCFSLAKDKSLVEFVLKVDEDDQETIKVANKIAELAPVKIITTPRGRGYFEVGTWANLMGRAAKGDWLLIFNDDARMTVQDWDQVLLHLGSSAPWAGIDDCCLLVFPTVGRPFAEEFVVLRKSTFDLLGGRFASCVHADNWLHTVMDFCGCALMANGIPIEHYSHLLEDEIRKSSTEAHKTSILTLTNLKSRWGMAKDVVTVLEFLEESACGLKWSDTPNGSGWWWWREGPGADMKNLLLDFSGNAISFEGGAGTKNTPWQERGGQWAPRWLA